MERRKTQISQRVVFLFVSRQAFNVSRDLCLPMKTGAIVYWLDYREDFGDSTEDAIYAQRLDADGKPLWEINGIPVCSAPKAQITPQAIAAGVNAAIVVWGDARGQDEDIYIQRVPQ